MGKPDAGAAEEPEEATGAVKVNKAQLRRAIAALQKHVAKKNEESNLLFNKNAETMTLLFSLAKVPQKGRLKPVLIPLPVPMYGEKSEICIFTKDPQKKYKELFAAHPVPGLKKVIAIDKLKKNYKTFDLKRQLCDNYDLFLCDRKVMDMMPQLLGKYFYQTKRRFPVPVLLEAKDPSRKVQEAIDSTTLRVPEGPSCGVRIGRCEMSTEDLLANAARVMTRTTTYFEQAGNSVTSISLQATNAPALPVWNTAAPEKLLERKRAAAGNSSSSAKPAVEEDDEDDDDDDDEDNIPSSKPSKVPRKEMMPLMQSGKRKKPAAAAAAAEQPPAKKNKKDSGTAAPGNAPRAGKKEPKRRGS